MSQINVLINKDLNPFGIDYVPFETILVRFVDHILEERIKMGRPTHVTNDNHWGLIEFIIEGWSELYPEYSHDFIVHMKRVRLHANHLGVSREGEAIIQHQLEIPQKLFQLIMVAFPDQKWDREFNLQFAKHFPSLKGADKL